MIKTLIDLKAICIAAEKTNRKLRSELDRDNVALIESGMRDKRMNSQPEQRARLFGNFSFKEKNQAAPVGGRDRTRARGTSDAHTHASAGNGDSRKAQSPALLKLLSTDHLQFRHFSRGMLLEDVHLLTRYQQKLEAETKQLKLEGVRMKRNLQQVDSRVGAPSRPRPTSILRQEQGAVDKVEQECHVALKLASVLDQIRRDKSRENYMQAAPEVGGGSDEALGAQERTAGGAQGGLLADGAPAWRADVAEAPPQRQAAEFCLEAQVQAHDSSGAAGPSSGERMPQVIYDVLIRNGTCRCPLKCQS